LRTAVRHIPWLRPTILPGGPQGGVVLQVLLHDVGRQIDLSNRGRGLGVAGYAVGQRKILSTGRSRPGGTGKFLK
jgi:hypothetical protein